MKRVVAILLIVSLAMVVSALSTSYSITEDVATVTYDLGSIPHEGKTVQLYHMDYGYPVPVAEWDAVSSQGTVSINLKENKIAATTFYTRITEQDPEGNSVEVTKPWWWLW